MRKKKAPFYYECGCPAQTARKRFGTYKPRCQLHGSPVDWKTLKKKTPKSPNQNLKKECDALWSKLIKSMAGWKSEYSGKTTNLVSHHLRGKNNYRLRYSLQNGYCCTAGEHSLGFHITGRREKMERVVKQQRGENIFAELDLLGRMNAKTSLLSTKVFLQNELKRLEGRDHA